LDCALFISSNLEDDMLGNELKKLIGKEVPNDKNEFKKRMRYHQGWWRTFVLAEEAGKNPANPEDEVCNTIINGEISKKNFLTPNALRAYEDTLQERNENSSGIVNEDRVWNNLLSSQPLCFNLFGDLKYDRQLAADVFRHWIPELATVDEVRFEYAPEERYTNDNSAFDVAFFFTTVDNQKGIFGLECKYTDDFSNKVIDKKEYQHVFEKSKGIFRDKYGQYINLKYNQLFRNQLLGEALKQNKDYDVTICGLVCHHDDERAIKIGIEFQDMLIGKHDRFKIITYKDYISTIQRLNVDWNKREWTMELWARYCGLRLSKYTARSRIG
jgi:hypothetical protein